MAVEVSRKDIITNEIVDVQSPDKFLKLPAEPYLDMLNIEPLESQIAMINAVNNPKYRFIVAALSRRQGKTYIANIIGQMVLLSQTVMYLLCPPTTPFRKSPLICREG